MAKKTSAKLPAEEAAAENPRETGRYSAPALEKGLDILEYLSERGDGSTLAQIADGIERTKGEIFRMLAVLEARGYVEREDERYGVTDKLFRVGMRRPKYRALADIATPLMRAFSEATRYPCHLAIPTGGQIVVIARAEGPDLVGVTVRIGYRQPFLVTGSGYCLLSFMSEANRLRAFEAIRPRITVLTGRRSTHASHRSASRAGSSNRAVSWTGSGTSPARSSGPTGRTPLRHSRFPMSGSSSIRSPRRRWETPCAKQARKYPPRSALSSLHIK